MGDIPLRETGDGSRPGAGSYTQDENISEEGSSGNGEGTRQGFANRRPPWWRLLTTRNLTLASLTLFTVIIIIVLATTCYLLKNPQECSGIFCTTPICIRTAAKLVENMDEEVDPCDNFYRFACGGFLRDSIIPDDTPGLEQFTGLYAVVKSQVRILLEEPIHPMEPHPFVLVKKMYKTCMNTSLIESRGLEPFFKILDSFGGWPVLEGDNWNEEAFDWQKSILMFRKNGFNYNSIINTQIAIDLRNSSRRIIRLGELTDDDSGHIREFLRKGINDEIVTAYYKYVVDILVYMGAPRDRAIEEMEELVLFEISLATISLSKTDRRSVEKLDNSFTIAELQVLHPFVNWMEYINGLLPPGLTVGEDEVINVITPDYLYQLEKIIKVTPKRVIANYLIWKITSFHVAYLREDLLKRQGEYETALSGITRERPRWESCMEDVKKWFVYTMSSLYVRKHFKSESRNNVLELTRRIKAQVNKMLENLDWMDEDTRKYAMDKAQAITTYIGYAEGIDDIKKLEEFYKGVEIDENKFMENILNLEIFNANYNFNQLRKPVKKTDWSNFDDSVMVNAYYSKSKNSMHFPAGILQGVFFSSDRPQYMNYGAIGYIIGHEVIHGFDDQGRQFDKNGLLSDWWAPATKERYLKKAQCFIEQYGNYTVKELNMTVNGNLTQGENIADNDGIKEAYLAYLTWVEEHGEEKPLPGLNYTPRQMYWLSAANVWCSKYRPATMRMYMETDNHPPDEFRLLGSLKNNEYFAEDFHCPLGSNMNPIHKCKVF